MKICRVLGHKTPKKPVYNGTTFEGVCPRCDEELVMTNQKYGYYEVKVV